jgi:hypothetical protein
MKQRLLLTLEDEHMEVLRKLSGITGTSLSAIARKIILQHVGELRAFSDWITQQKNESQKYRLGIKAFEESWRSHEGLIQDIQEIEKDV